MFRRFGSSGWEGVPVFWLCDWVAFSTEGLMFCSMFNPSFRGQPSTHILIKIGVSLLLPSEGDTFEKPGLHITELVE